ncbi:MAG: hypothetical protein AAFY35_08910 [Pseudomonadota bacterium]
MKPVLTDALSCVIGTAVVTSVTAPDMAQTCSALSVEPETYGRAGHVEL